jgi:DNA-binding MarR family transcriptional regulator
MELAKERSLGFWCARIGQRYFTLLQERLAHLGIERGYFVLSLIVEHEGRISQQELADALHMDKVAMARCIDHLCACGFIERATCPDDRRKHHLKLLPKAAQAAKEIKKAHTALDRLALKELSSDERDLFLLQLRNALGRLHEGRSTK